MRIYDNKYLSVTSIVGLRDPFDDTSFKNWCLKMGKNASLISATSRILGSKVSEMLDNHSKGLDWLTAPPIDDLEARLLEGVEDFLKHYDLIETEKKVVCDKLHYAGTMDGEIIYKKTKEVILADWKTFGAYKEKPYKRNSKKIKHTRWQLTMYAYAMNWKDSLGVVVFKNDGTWEIEKVKFDEGMLEWIVENEELILETIKENKTIRY